jgi:hypothetical protein
MVYRSLLLVLLCSGTFALYAASPHKEESSQECTPKSKHMRASVRHIEAGGIGYNKGYSTIETFLASDPNQWCVMPFLDLRWHIFNDAKMDVNAGVGARGQLGSRAYGVNFYYDYRNTHKRGYNQIGLGLETLGTLWDLRINGYLPVGGKVSNPYDASFGGFKGNSILVDRKFEYAMKGIDGEVGFHFGKTADFDFYASAGPYYFKGEMGSGAIGGKAKVAGYYKQYVTLELSDSYDSVFKNNVQGQVTLTLPFGPKSRPIKRDKKDAKSCDYYVTMADRMVQPVERQEIVVVDHHTKSKAASVGVFFVDNLSNSAGTFESPYPTLAEALGAAGAGDIIYVFPGDGSSTGLNAGGSPYVLQNDQQLLGASTQQTVSTNLGTITIPSQAALRPYLTAGANTNVIQVANGNVISGLHIVVPGGAPNNWAVGSTSDIQGLTVTNNLLQSQADQILLINLGNGAGSPLGDINISNNMIFANRKSGAAIYGEHASSGSLNLSVVNNQISGFIGDSFYFYSIDGLVNATIENNRFLNAASQYAIQMDSAGTAKINVNMNKNLIQNNRGIQLGINDSSVMTLNMNENEIYAAGGYYSPYDIYIYVDNNATFTGLVEDSSLQALDYDNRGVGIYASTSGASSVDLTVRNCNILASNIGIELFSQNTSNFTGTIENNHVGMSINAGYALEVSSEDSSTMNLVCNSNTLTGPRSTVLNSNSIGLFTAALNNNQLNGQTTQAVLSTTNISTGTMNVSCVSNQIVGPAGTDDYVVGAFVNSGGTLYFDFEKNSLTSGGIGISGASTNTGSSLVARVISNFSETLQGDSFIANTGNPTACVNYQNNTGISSNTFTNSGGGTFTLYYNGNNQASVDSGTTPGVAGSCSIP